MEGPSPLEAVPCLTVPKQMSWSWVPKGMDRNTACRIAVCVGPYVDESCQEYNVTRNFRLVIDRDTANLKDLLSDLAVQVKHGNEHSMILTFWDKNMSSFVELKSDTCLLCALDMYWDVRKLPLSVTVTETETEISPACDQQCSGLATDHGEPPLLLEHNNVGDGSNTVDASKEGDAIKAIDGQASAWTDDQIEYVGLNDEMPYRHLLSDSESGTDSDYSLSDEDPDDVEHVDDGPECVPNTWVQPSRSHLTGMGSIHCTHVRRKGEPQTVNHFIGSSTHTVGRVRGRNGDDGADGGILKEGERERKREGRRALVSRKVSAGVEKGSSVVKRNRISTLERINMNFLWYCLRVGPDGHGSRRREQADELSHVAWDVPCVGKETFREEWQLRILVLGSLPSCTYLGSDALAIYALATLFNRQKKQDGTADGSQALEVMWAPILLIHLAGQDAITAYNIEDNELWRRHIVTAISQVTVAICSLRLKIVITGHRV
ncbi:hypothetical protein EJB05_52660, partial [Eragrostis curvula]